MNKIFVNNIGDLAEAQRASFYRFLSIGITEELETFTNPFVTNIRVSPRRRYPSLVYLYPSQMKLKGPLSSMEMCFQYDLSYTIQIYIGCVYYYPVEKDILDCSLANHFSSSFKRTVKVRMHQDIFFGDIPLMTEEGTFIINGCERIIISQIIRSPGIYFRKEFGASAVNTLYTATIISNKGLWTKIVYDSYKEKKDEYDRKKEAKIIDRIYIKLNEYRRKSSDIKEKKEDNTNKLFLGDFLQYFGLTFAEISDSLKSPYLFLSKHIEENSLNPRQNDSEDIYELVHDMFLNQRSGFFSIGEIGRYKINKKLGLNLPKDATNLTVYDFLGILDGLIELKYFDRPSDDIDDIKNKLIRSVGELLQNQLRIGLYRLKRIVANKSSLLNSQKVNFDAEPASDPDDWIIDPRALTNSIRDFFKTSQLSQFMDQINPLSELTHKRRISVFGPNGLKRDHISTVIRDIHPSQYGRLCPIETPEGQNAGLISSVSLFGRIGSLGSIETPYFLMDKERVYSSHKPIFLNPEQESETAIAFCDGSFSPEKKVNKEYISTKENYLFSIRKMEEIKFMTTSPLQIVSLATALIPFLEHDDANRALMGSNMQRQAVPLLYTQKPIVGTGLEAVAILDSGMVIKSYSEGFVSFSSAYSIEIEDNSKQSIFYLLKKYTRSNQETAINQRPLVWEGEKVYSGQIIADGPSTNDGELSLGRNLTIAYMPWEGYNYEDAIVINERILVDDCLTSVHIEEYETTIGYNVYGREKITKDLSHLTKYIRRHLSPEGIVRLGSYVKQGDILVGKLTPCEEDPSPERRLLRALSGKKEKNVRDTSLRVAQGSEGRVIDIRILSNNHFNPEMDFPLKKEEILEKKKNDSSSKKEKKGKIEISITNDKQKNLNLSEEKEEPKDFNELASNFGDTSIHSSLETVRIYVAQIRKIQVGDKLAGRHGNKGIVSRILPRQDMPYLPDGTAIDILFNPLGVPSRMNVGQVFECLLGLAGENLGSRFKVFPFDEIYGKEASRILVNQKLKEAAIVKGKDWLFNSYYPGKILLKDGRTGEFFDNPITVGKSYILKLIHLVEDKIHARATGPYAMITEQPLAGKSQKGGQRFGEMEVWAIEAYGCSNTLQELLTIKSDDMDGRNDMYESILVRKEIEKPTPSLPEAFLTLMRELHALGLDFSMKKIENGCEIFSIGLDSELQKIEKQGNHFEEEEPIKDIFLDVELRLKLRALLARKKMEQFVKPTNFSEEEEKRKKEKRKEKKKVISHFKETKTEHLKKERK